MSTRPRPRAVAEITVTLEVPEYWIDQIVSGDVFAQSACGYWATPIRESPYGGWLVHNTVAEDLPSYVQRAELRKTAIRCFVQGLDLPAGYHRFDQALAVRAFGELVRFHGAEEVPDGPATDRAIQRALFGEERYG